MAGKYQAYPEYKDSGVDWLGEVPEDWGLANLSSLSNKITNGYVGPTREIFQDSGVRYLQSLHIKKNKINFHTPYYVSEEWSRGKVKSILQEGDVLIVQTGDIGQVAAVSKEYENCNCHALIIVSTTDKLDGFYLAWLLNSDYGFHSLKSIQTGALHPHLNCDTVKTIKTPIPSLFEQIKIANFLDHETAKIDTLIEKQHTLIKLLKEKRQAVISHAVTKGLNPDAPMRDSGVEWLGVVPEHWEFVMIGKKIQLQRGIDITKDQQIEGEIPVVSSGGISSFHNQYTCKGPGVVVGRKGTAGKLHYIDRDFWAHDTTLYVKKFNGNNIRYTYYKLLSMQLETYDTGSANPTLNRNNIHPEKVSWAPIDEQGDIVDYLDKFCFKADRITDKINNAIALLQERRTALISAAVTGKIDVRNWKAPEPKPTQTLKEDAA